MAMVNWLRHPERRPDIDGKGLQRSAMIGTCASEGMSFIAAAAGERISGDGYRLFTGDRSVALGVDRSETAVSKVAVQSETSKTSFSRRSLETAPVTKRYSGQ
jgi:hypothetical protein